MADFWGGVAQGFGPAYEASSRRRDKKSDLAEAAVDRIIEEYIRLGGDDTRAIEGRDKPTLLAGISDLTKAAAAKKRRLAEADKREQRGYDKQVALSIEQRKLDAVKDRARLDQEAIIESLPPAARERALGGHTLFTGKQPLPATSWRGQELGPDTLKGLPTGEVGQIGKYEALSPVQRKGAALAGQRIVKEEADKSNRLATHELAKAMAELQSGYRIKEKKIPTPPSSADTAKVKGTRELAKHHSLTPALQKRFYSNVDIEDANPAVLEAINEQVKAAQKEIDTINLSESGETAVYFGQVYIPQFRKLDREIKADAAAGKEIDQARLDLLRDKGNTLITFYSTHGRKAVPEDVDSLIGNAAKIPGAPVLRSITDAQDSAVLAEDIARDIVALKDAVGEDAMLKAVGKIDRPLIEIQKTLGLFVDSKQFQKIEKLIQKSQGLNNIILKIRSGAAVTESEAARFLKEFADPSRQNYFTALQNFAENERNKVRMALKTQQDAGYFFNKKLVDSIGAGEAAPTAEEPSGEPSKYQGLSREEARKFDLLKKTDPALMNPTMKELLELYKEKSGGK